MPIKRADIIGILGVLSLIVGMAMAAMSFSGSGNAGYVGDIGSPKPVEGTPTVTVVATETVVPTPTIVVLFPTVNPEIESIEVMPETGAGSTASGPNASFHSGYFKRGIYKCDAQGYRWALMMYLEHYSSTLHFWQDWRSYWMREYPYVSCGWGI